MDNVTSQVVNITLIDKEYQIKCPIQEKTALLKAATHLEQRILQIKGNTRASSLEQIILLAALNISNDYIDKNNDQNTAIETFNQNVQRLKDKLEHALIF